MQSFHNSKVKSLKCIYKAHKNKSETAVRYLISNTGGNGASGEMPVKPNGKLFGTLLINQTFRNP